MRFTPAQILWLARYVSGGRGDIPTAVGICFAESSGDPGNFLVNTPTSVDRGLWQINSYWHREVSNACAYVPLCNARQAYRISNGWRDFTPWATFNSGAYRSYVPSPFLQANDPGVMVLTTRYPPAHPSGAPGGLGGPLSSTFTPTAIAPSSTNGGGNSAPRIHKTGKTAAEHGSGVNDRANAIFKLAQGRRRF